MKNTNISTSKQTIVVSCILNILVVLFELSTVVFDFIRRNTDTFVYYTNDSNYLALIACLLVVMCELPLIAAYNGNSGKKEIPYAVQMVKYIATCCLLLTFTVVVTILVPVGYMSGDNGLQNMFGSYQLFMRHFVCPVLAAVSFIFFEQKPVLSRKALLFAEIPTILYAAVTLLLNILRVIDGPYPFLRVYNQGVALSFVWGVAIIAISFLLAWIIWRLNHIKKAA